jgi:hypothetical protein
MKCDHCDNEATTQIQAGAWSSSACDEHPQASKHLAEALGITVYGQVDLRPRAEPTDPQLMLATASAQLQELATLRTELERDLETERRSHASTREAGEKYRDAALRTNELERKLTDESQLLFEARLQLQAMKETQEQNAAMKVQLERVTAELERVTTLADELPGPTTVVEGG